MLCRRIVSPRAVSRIRTVSCERASFTTSLRLAPHTSRAARNRQTRRDAEDCVTTTFAGTQGRRGQHASLGRASRCGSPSCHRKWVEHSHTRTSLTQDAQNVHASCTDQETTADRRGTAPHTMTPPPLSCEMVNHFIQLSNSFFDRELAGVGPSSPNGAGAMHSTSDDDEMSAWLSPLPCASAIANGAAMPDSAQDQCSTDDVMDLLLTPEMWQSTVPPESSHVSRTTVDVAHPAPSRGRSVDRAAKLVTGSTQDRLPCLVRRTRAEDDVRSLLAVDTSHPTHTYLRQAVRLLLRGLVWRRMLNTNATLAECDVADKALEQGDFTQMVWRQVHARSCTFNRSVFYAVTLQDSVFEDCDFTGCVLSHVRCLGRVRFLRCNFSKAQIQFQTSVSCDSSNRGGGSSGATLTPTEGELRHTEIHRCRNPHRSTGSSSAVTPSVEFDMCDFDLAEFSREGASALRHPRCFRRCRNTHLAANFPLRVCNAF